LKGVMKVCATTATIIKSSTTMNDYERDWEVKLGAYGLDTLSKLFNLAGASHDSRCRGRLVKMAA
jgi:hypothetical protein